VTVEDGVATGGIGSRIAQTLRASGCDVPTREIGIPVRFLEHGSVAVVRAAAGLTVQDIGRRIVEWSAELATTGESGEITAAQRAREFGAD
jgi:1-deoxy-D-xylulose-5-phosphate synthase